MIPTTGKVEILAKDTMVLQAVVVAQMMIR